MDIVPAALEEIQQKFFMQAQWNLFAHSIYEDKDTTSWEIIGKGSFDTIQ